jgi:hypothetical protein
MGCFCATPKKCGNLDRLLRGLLSRPGYSSLKSPPYVTPHHPNSAIRRRRKAQAKGIRHAHGIHETHYRESVLIRSAAEAKIREADRLECEAWNAIMWAGGPAMPSPGEPPTIGKGDQRWVRSTGRPVVTAAIGCPWYRFGGLRSRQTLRFGSWKRRSIVNRAAKGVVTASGNALTYWV